MVSYHYHLKVQNYCSELPISFFFFNVLSSFYAWIESQPAVPLPLPLSSLALVTDGLRLYSDRELHCPATVHRVSIFYYCSDEYFHC